MEIFKNTKEVEPFMTTSRIFKREIIHMKKINKKIKKHRKLKKKNFRK